MKGIIFNLLEQVVTDDYGSDTWDALLSEAGLDGAYTSLGNYADEDLLALVGVASVALSTPVDDLLRWFGRSSIPLLAERHPQFFESHTTTQPFLMTINDVIHAEVRKLYPDAAVPTFTFLTTGDGRFALGYASQRQMCALAEGFIDGAATYFGERVEIEQIKCMTRGDPSCVIACTFA